LERHCAALPKAHDLPRDVLKKQRFRPRLARLVYDDDIKCLRHGTDILCHPVDGHNPRGYRRSAVLHVLAGSPPVDLGVFACALPDSINGLLPRDEVFALNLSES
jgi:hypothetical protein